MSVINKRLLFVAILLTLSVEAFGQRDWTWMFGDSIAMEFSGGGSPIVKDSVPCCSFFETAGCLSDDLGRLILYMDSDSIYNRFGKAICPQLSDPTITQGSLILPILPSNFVKVLSLHPGPYCNLRSTTIDVNQNGGLGDVHGTRDSILFDALPRLTEKLSATRDATGQGWWIVSHLNDTATFALFHLTSDTIIATFQNIGTNHQLVGANYYFQLGQMCFSPKGTQLLVVTPTVVIDLFDFDRCSGTLSNWIPLGTLATNPSGNNHFYGCSFSPNGTKIYVSEEWNPVGSRLFQFDLLSGNIANSRTVVYQSPIGEEIGQHRLGPDGKCYVTTPSLDSTRACNFYLSRIENPDSSGFNCNFNYQAVNLRGRRARLGLPNLPNYNLGPLLAQTAEAGPNRLICPGDSIQLGYPDTTGGRVEYLWTGPGVFSDTFPQPWVTPAATAWYYLQAYDPFYGISCGYTYDSVLVTVADSAQIPVAIVGADTLFCRGDSLLLGLANADSNFVYSWSTVPANNYISSPNSSQTLVSGSGSYFLQVTNPAGIGTCFTDTDEVKVTTYTDTLPQQPAGVDSILCAGDSLVLGTVAPNGSWVFHWSPNVGLDNADVSMPHASPDFSTTYLLEAWDSSFAGHCAVVSDTVSLNVEFPFAHEAPKDVSFCLGECFRLGVAPVDGYLYQWSPPTGLTSPTASLTKAQPTASTLYTLTVTNPAMQSANCRDQRYPAKVTADGCHFQSFIAVNGDGVAEVLDFGDHAGAVDLRVYDATGKLVFWNMDYDNTWSAATLMRGMYIYRVAVAGECAMHFTGKVLVVR